MWTLWQDLRYSARLLARHPGFTLTAIGVLTLGIGVNAGIFGIINGLMLRPLAGASAPGEAVGVYSKDRTTERGYRAFSYPGFIDLRDARRPVRACRRAQRGARRHHRRHDHPPIAGRHRQHRIFRGARGAGRSTAVISPSTRSGRARQRGPAIVSYGCGRRAGSIPSILKQTVRINGDDYAIVGVTPKGFGGTTAIIGTEYFLPLGVHDAIESDFDSRDRFALSDRRNHSLIVVGRLKPGVTRAQADEQLKVIAAAHEQAYPAENKNQDLIARPLGRLGISTSPQDDTQLWVPMTMLQGLAAAVLLTSCLNLANMMLAFGSARQKEIAIRLAVGGARARIVRQLLVQGLMLSLAGGALGLLAATWAAQLLVSSMATVLPITLALDLTPDTTVLGATLLFCARRDGRLRAVAGAAAVAAGPVDVAQGPGGRSIADASAAASACAARSSPRRSRCRSRCWC